MGDSSGSGNNGTLSGAGATWTAGGKNGGALSFNGSSGNVTVPHSASISLNPSYTLEAWVKPTALSGYQTVLIKEVTGGCGGCGNERWRGLLDDVRIYSRPLTATEIQTDLNTGVS